MLTQGSLSTTKESTIFPKTDKLIFTALNTLPNGTACFSIKFLIVLSFNLDGNDAND